MDTATELLLWAALAVAFVIGIARVATRNPALRRLAMSAQDHARAVEARAVVQRALIDILYADACESAAAGDQAAAWRKSQIESAGEARHVVP